MVISYDELNNVITQALLDNGLMSDDGVPPFDWPLPDTRLIRYINKTDFFDLEDTVVVDLLTAIDYSVSNLINKLLEPIEEIVVVNKVTCTDKVLRIEVEGCNGNSLTV